MRTRAIYHMLAGSMALCLAVLILLFISIAARATEEKVDMPTGAEAGPILVHMDADGVTLRFGPPAGTSGTVEAELCDLGGKLLARASIEHQGRPVEVVLAGPVRTTEPANYYVRYRFTGEESFRSRSLFLIAEVSAAIGTGSGERA